MIPISEKLHVKRLNENDLVIEDRYLKKTYDGDKILVRATDLLRDDQINGYPRIEKAYFHKGNCIYIEKEFDPNVRYTYLVEHVDKKIVICPCCGYKGKTKEFILGCPYCNANLRVDFIARQNAKINKLMNYKVLIAIFLIAYSLLARFYLKSLIAWLIYLIPAFILYLPIVFIISIIISTIKASIPKKTIFSELKKAKIIQNENRVYNDLYVELNNYYYNSSKNSKEIHMIDYEIVKYHNVEHFVKGDDEFLNVSYDIRKYYFIDEKINRVVETNKAELVKNKHIGPDSTATQCRNCGASYPLAFRECEYCGTINESRCEWILERVSK